MGVHADLDGRSCDVEGYLLLRFYIYLQTPTEITKILKHKLSQTEYKLSMYYGWVYDSAWTLALGLNNSLSHLNDSGLDGYTNNPYYLNAIMKGMLGVQFEGLSVSCYHLSWKITALSLVSTKYFLNMEKEHVEISIYERMWFCVPTVWTENTMVSNFPAFVL